jgi:hypothetical protein
MSVIAREKYSPERIEKIEDYLKTYSEMGQPIDYEIIVDRLKVVRRTNNPDLYKMHEGFINSQTKSVEILIYSGQSNNNDKYIFFFSDEEEKDKGLSGLEINQRIEDHVRKAQEKWEFDLLKKENSSLKQELAELESEVAALEKEKEEILSRQSPLNGLLGEVGSSFVESFIKRNPSIIANLPGGQALAGLLDDDSKVKEAREDTEVSFKSKGQSTNHLSETDRNSIEFVNQLKASFSKDEFDDILVVLEMLAQDKSKIKQVIKDLEVTNE